MNEAVDTRVVEAKFDSKQFEQGVDKTVKKLDELKKSLNLKDSEKSVADIGAKIEEASNKASEALDKLNNRFTSFTGMLKQKLLSGIADEIVGVFFKIKNGFEGLVKSLSTSQVSYGMQRYKDILTSVRTLVSAGESQDASYNVVERLGEYADQTSYSLDQLVSTMSKFKTSGASLSTAQRMVEGLSNAAASMGVNAQQASRAYLNLQQAYSKGAMLNQDWVSFESLPMVGTKFNEKILEAAVEVGTLKKEANGTYTATKKALQEAGRTSNIKTSNRADIKGITAENMGTKLASRWFNKQVMEKVFGEYYYFSEVGIDAVNDIKDDLKEYDDLLKKGTISQEEYNKRVDEYFEQATKNKIADETKRIKQEQADLNKEYQNGAIAEEEYKASMKSLTEELNNLDKNINMTRFGWEAFRAGQEARSFTDVLNTLKDTISRGWAKSFELLFGQLDEAADFFTNLTESNLAEMIYKIGDFRNSILEGWRDLGGRDSLIGALEHIDELLGDIFKHFGWLDRDKNKVFDQKLYDDIFNNGGYYAAESYRASVYEVRNVLDDMVEDLSLRLSIASAHIEEFFYNLRQWMNETVDGDTRINRIKKVFDDIGRVFSAVAVAISKVYSFTSRIFKQFDHSGVSAFDNLRKAITPFLDAVDPKTERGKKFWSDIDHIFNNILQVTQPLANILPGILNILGGVGEFFADMAISTFTMNAEFISDSLGLLLEIFGIESSQTKEGLSVWDKIKNSIKELGDACKDAFKFVHDFAESVINDIRNLLGLNKDVKDQNENGGLFSNIANFFETSEFVQKVKAWFDKAIQDVGDFIRDFPNRIQAFSVNIGDAFKSLFYTKTTVMTGPGQSQTTWVKKKYTEELEKMVADVWHFITVDIPNTVKNIPSIVGKFFESLFYRKEKTGYDSRGFETYKVVQTPLKDWIDTAIANVKKFIKTIPEKIKKIPSLVEEFFRNIFYDKKENVDTGLKGRDGRPLLGTVWEKSEFTKTLESIWNTVLEAAKDFISHIPTYINTGINIIGSFVRTIIGALFGRTDTGDSLANSITSEEVQAELEKPFQNLTVNNILNTLRILGTNIANQILSIFTGTDDWASNKNSLAESVASGIGWIKDRASEVWENVRTFFAELPGKISAFFTGEAKTEDGEETGPSPILTAIEDFGKKIGEKLSELPDMILNIVKSAGAIGAGLWDKVVNLITGGSTEYFDQSIYDMIDAQEGWRSAEDYKATHPEKSIIVQNLETFFNNIINYVKERIENFPKDFTAGLATVTGVFDKVFQAVTKWFSGENQNGEKDTKIDGENSPLLENLKQIGENIKNIITVTIPKFITEGFDYLKNNIGGWVAAVAGIFGASEEDKASIKERVDSGLNKMFEDPIGATIGSLIEKIRTGFQGLPDRLGEWAGDIAFLFGGDEAKERVSKEVSGALHNLFDTPISTHISNLSKTISNALQSAFRKNTFNQDLYDTIYNNTLNSTASAEDALKAAESYKSQTSNPIYEFFKNLIHGIGTLFTTLGPTILDGINTAINWLGKKITGLTNEIAGWVDSGIKIDDLSKQKSDNPLWESIKSLGKTIWKMLTETLPKFIESAIEWVSIQIPDILGKLFGNKETQEKVIGSVFNEDMFESSPVFDSAKVFDPKEYQRILKEDGQVAADAYKKVCEDYAKSTKKTNKKMQTEVGNEAKNGSNFLSVMADMLGGAFGVSIASAEESNGEKGTGLFGIGWLDNIFEPITNFYNKIKNNTSFKVLAVIALIVYILKQLNDLTDQLQVIDDIGQTAKWVGIGSILTAIASILGYLAILGDSAEEGTKEAAKFNRVKGVLEKFMQDIKDIMDRLNWFMGFLMVKQIASTISDLRGDDDDKEVKERAKTKLGKVGEWIQDTFGGLLDGLLGGFGETVGKTTGALVTGGAISTLIDQLSSSANDAMGELGSGMEMLSTNVLRTVDNLEKVMENNKIDTAIKAVDKVKDLIIKTIGLMQVDIYITDEEKALIDKKDSKATIFDYLGDRADRQEEYISDSSKYHKYSVSVLSELGPINNTLIKLSGTLSLFKNAVTGYGRSSQQAADALGRILGMQDSMATFGKFVKDDENGYWSYFKDALMSLGAIFRLYSDSIDDDFSETPKTLNIENAVDMLEQLFTNDRFKSLITMLSKKENMPEINDEAIKTAERLIIFAASLSSIAKACRDVKASDSEGINNLVSLIQQIAPSDDQTKVTQVASAFGILGNSLSSFAFETSTLNADAISNAEHAITMLLRLAVGLKDIPSDAFIVELFTGNQQIDKFGQRIAELGQNLGKFFDSIQNLSAEGKSVDYNQNNLRMAMNTIITLAHVAMSLDGIKMESFASFTGLNEKFGNFAKAIASCVNILLGKDETIKFETYSDNDFEYLNRMLEIIDFFSLIIARVDKLELKNLDSWENHENPLVDYIDRFMVGLANLGSRIRLNAEGLGFISEYKKNIDDFIEMFNSLLKSIQYISMRRGVTSELSRWFTSIANGFFGEDVPESIWNIEKARNENTIVHKDGLFEKLLDYFDGLNELQDKIKDNPEALSVFNRIADMIEAFSEALSAMAISAATSNASDEYIVNYEQYVYNMADALEAILKKEDVFRRFFAFGGSLSSAYVQNGLTMMTMLNQLSQFLMNIDSMQLTYASNYSVFVDRLKKIDWAELFAVINQEVIYQNKDLFEPHIKPVLELDKDFEDTAKRMRELMGIDISSGKMKLNANDIGSEQNPLFHLLADPFSYAIQQAVAASQSLPTVNETAPYTAVLNNIDTSVTQMTKDIAVLDSDMKRMKFIIDAKPLVYAVGPTMDEWLGQYGTYTARGYMLGGESYDM